MVWRKELPPLIVDTFIQQMNQLTDNRQVDYVNGGRQLPFAKKI